MPKSARPLQSGFLILLLLVLPRFAVAQAARVTAGPQAMAATDGGGVWLPSFVISGDYQETAYFGVAFLSSSSASFANYHYTAHAINGSWISGGCLVTLGEMLLIRLLGSSSLDECWVDVTGGWGYGDYGD